MPEMLGEIGEFLILGVHKGRLDFEGASFTQMDRKNVWIRGGGGKYRSAFCIKHPSNVLFTAQNLKFPIQIPAKRKNSADWANPEFAVTIKTTIKFPTATVNCQHPCSTDFILSGACVKENWRPVTEYMTSPSVITWKKVFNGKSGWGRILNFSLPHIAEFAKEH